MWRMTTTNHDKLSTRTDDSFVSSQRTLRLAWKLSREDGIYRNNHPGTDTHVCWVSRTRGPRTLAHEDRGRGRAWPGRGRIKNWSKGKNQSAILTDDLRKYGIGPDNFDETKNSIQWRDKVDDGVAK